MPQTGSRRRLADLEVPSEKETEPLLQVLVERLRDAAGCEAACVVTFDRGVRARLRARSSEECDPSCLGAVSREDGDDPSRRLEAACAAAHPGRCPRALPLSLDGEAIGSVVFSFATAPEKKQLAALQSVVSVAGVALGAYVAKEKASRNLDAMDKYREIFMGMWEQSGDAVIALDLDGKVLVWNEVCERVFGWREEEVVGAALPELSSEHTRTVLAEVRRAASEPVSELSLPVAHRNGSPLTVHAGTISVPDVEGNTASVVLVARVLTADDPLDNVRGDMVSALAERMKPPLTALIGYSQLLSRPAMLEDSSRRVRIAQGMETHAHALATLIEDLQLFAQVRRGELRLDIDSLDLGAVVFDLAAALRETRPGGFSVEAEGTDHIVLADPVRLRRALQHMLKACASLGDRKQAVRVSLGEVDGDAVLDVGVPGFVMPSEQAALMFERSFRLPDHESDRESTGGLFLAQAIAQAHGGSLTAVSQAGDPVVLRLRLPRQPRLLQL